MKSSSLVLLTALAPLAAVAQAPKITIDGETVTVTIGDYSALPTALVPFTAESTALLVAGQTADEANLFGSGLRYDLDGDGAFTGKFPVACEGGALSLAMPQGKVMLSPLFDGAGFYYIDAIKRLAPKGASAVLYGPCSAEQPGFVGLAAGDMVVEQRKGPVLQVNLMEALPAHDAPSQLKLVDLKLDGKSVDAEKMARVNERVSAQTPMWHALQWAMVPLPKGAKALTFKVVGSAPFTVVARLNSSPAHGRRTLGPNAFKAVSRVQRAALVKLADRALAAYKAQDIKGLVAVIPPEMRERMAPQLKKGGGRFKSLFGPKSWRMKAATAFSGTYGEARINGRQARLSLQVAEGDRTAMVQFEQVGGAWYLDDLQRVDLGEFASWGQPLK